MTQHHQIIRFLPCGDTAFSMEFGSGIDRATNARIIALYRKAKQRPMAGVIEMIPTFRSLMVLFDPENAELEALQLWLSQLLGTGDHDEEPGRRWTLPVCYEGEFAPDIADVAQESGLTAEDVWRCHAGQAYFVYMIGFLPGYGYMGDVPEPIRVPRMETPRTRVPRGSIAIAQDMTAVYSLESPGGWRLIGRTPVPLFDPTAEMPVLLAPGDTVRFEPVSSDTYSAIERDIVSGAYALQPDNAA